jgi:hypothetical protein
MEKFRSGIRDKHPGFAILVHTFSEDSMDKLKLDQFLNKMPIKEKSVKKFPQKA